MKYKALAVIPLLESLSVLIIYDTGTMNSSSPVTLDYTLRDLYVLDSDQESLPTLLYCPVRGDKDGPPSPSKFIYHYEPPAAEATGHTWLTMALNILPQRQGFMASKMPLIILNPHAPGPESTPTDLEARVSFSKLRCDQQPILSYTTDPGRVCLERGSSIAVAMPSDYVSKSPA